MSRNDDDLVIEMANSRSKTTSALSGTKNTYRSSTKPLKKSSKSSFFDKLEKIFYGAVAAGLVVFSANAIHDISTKPAPDAEIDQQIAEIYNNSEVKEYDNVINNCIKDLEKKYNCTIPPYIKANFKLRMVGVVEGNIKNNSQQKIIPYLNSIVAETKVLTDTRGEVIGLS